MSVRLQVCDAVSRWMLLLFGRFPFRFLLSLSLLFCVAVFYMVYTDCFLERELSPFHKSRNRIWLVVSWTDMLCVFVCVLSS